MGRYLVIDDKENNSKQISYLMANLLRTVVKKENLSNGWALELNDIATVVINVDYLLENKNSLEAFLENNKNEYWALCLNSFEDAKKLLHTVFDIFSVVLAEAILDDKKLIHAYWE